VDHDKPDAARDLAQSLLDKFGPGGPLGQALARLNGLAVLHSNTVPKFGDAAARILAGRDPVIARLLEQTGPPRLGRPVGTPFAALVRAIELSRATMGNIRLNLVFAFVDNGVGIPIAGGLLYPFWGLLLNPMIASAAMSLSSVSVIANSLRLRRVA